MENHEKLEKICNIIGYDYIYPYVNGGKFNWCNMDEYLEDWEIYFSEWEFRKYDPSNDRLEYIDCNLSEIIFTTDFIDKIQTYLWKNDWDGNGVFIVNYADWRIKLTENLDNPVEYLYKLLWLWK